MKRFSGKTSRFGSLLSLIALSAMLMVYAASLPNFLVSATGQIFAVVWGIFALTMFTTHAISLSASRKSKGKAIVLAAGPKDAQTVKGIRKMRLMRG